jgi:predicted RecA/RadA family phage recombinase
MATRAVLLPEAAHYPATNFPALLLSNRRPVLAFDASTSETAYWTFVAPQGITGTLTAVISYAMASATTGGVAFDVALEAISSGDALDTDATTSFDSVNTGTDAAVPGTAGYMEQISITLTNADSIAAADLVRVSVARAVANGADTATGDCYLIACEIRDGA